MELLYWAKQHKIQIFSNLLLFFLFSVKVNIVDEEQRKSIHSYDPQAPVTRKGVLTSLRTGRPMEIKEPDLVKCNYC